MQYKMEIDNDQIINSNFQRFTESILLVFTEYLIL
jgi:hypothetical protein